MYINNAIELNIFYCKLHIFNSYSEFGKAKFIGRCSDKYLLITITVSDNASLTEVPNLYSYENHLQVKKKISQPS